MADDPMDMLNKLGGLMQSAGTLQAVDNMMTAYNEYAHAAYCTLLETTDPTDLDPKKIAAEAWKFADAMMEERSARGLGGPKRTPPPDDALPAE